MIAPVQIRLARASGTLRRRRRVPRQRPPRQVQRFYLERLNAVVDLIESVIAPVVDELPRLVASAAADRADLRTDQGEGRRVRELMRLARTAADDAALERDMERVLEGVARRTAEFNASELSRQYSAGIGVNPLFNDRGLERVIDGFVSENAALVTDMTPKALAEIEQLTTRGIVSGRTSAEITRDIETRIGVTRSRAKLIARDQIGKVNGQINAFRQQRLGATKFIWRTSGDERVRDEHDSRNGVTYEFASPPGGELPGEPINCRCHPEPVFDDLLAGL